MIVGHLTISQYEKNQMGQVTATITATNHGDQILAEWGFISVDNVRSPMLEKVLVDTEATLLSLPTAMIAILGLPVGGTTSVKT